MQKPIEIGWRNVTPSQAVATLIQSEAARLERASDRIVGCTVRLEAPSRHHRHSGGQYRVRLEVSIPRGRIVVGRNPPLGTDTHEDLYAVVKQAFREARRQLEDRVRRLDGRVKAHAAATEGVVVRLFPDEHYGFLRTPDGRDVYFHANAVVRGQFPRLEVGRGVRFVEESGDEGPQASTVDPLPVRRSAPAH
ncbi:MULTISPECIES: HPF/RaiA family ribosome-associated protein [Anaeromyxobacter]|uniref:HPF/RaiA family ribosome-associated protein n=1 Tax=Anaeromyxobacter TaxID=161492 RepID=UPI001F56BFB1|nr:MULTISPECIES: HPF/RaiA family ribosome-associated protein [unclassified Anaeromyxobacter]